MIYADSDDYKWGSTKFVSTVGNVLHYPQVLVAKYPLMEKWFFEIAEDIRGLDVTTIPVLPGSVVDGGMGYSKAKRALTDFLRLPTFDELRYYERNTRI